MTAWRIIDRERFKAQIQFEPTNLFIGVFWQRLHRMPAPWYTLHIFIYIVPTLALHLTILKTAGKKHG